MFIGFDQIITNWYLNNKRNLPWRNTSDAYTIWLSEVILQQTRVNQGLPYFNKFIEKYPTVSDLALAEEETILRDWQGLGYYSRARNMHATARFIHENLNGIFPSSYNELIKLKGIGKYTAAAIASFSANENVAVVDGNVYRVLSRFLGIETDVASASAYKIFEQASLGLLQNVSPNDYNQAIMEFGALHCTPQNPACENCPVNSYCFAFNQQKVQDFPVKSKKLKIKKRYFNYYIITNQNNNIFISKRTHKDIWLNLYEFYLVELEKESTEYDLNLDKIPFDDLKIMNVDMPKIHKLTHQHLHITFIWVKTTSDSSDFKDIETIKELPKPIILAEYLLHFEENILNSLKK